MGGWAVAKERTIEIKCKKIRRRILIMVDEDYERKAWPCMVRYLCFSSIHFYEMIMSETGQFPNAFSPTVEVENWGCVGGDLLSICQVGATLGKSSTVLALCS